MMNKKIIAFVLVITGILIQSIDLQAKEKDFTGIIVYNISYENTDMDPQMQAMMPKTMKMKVKGDKSRIEMSMGMGNTVVVFNGAEKTGFTLMDMMGQKLAMEMDQSDIDKSIEEAPDVEIEVTNETKEIAGYTCKKAIVKSNEESSENVDLVVYFTEELGSGMLNFNNNPVFKDIKGVMMEYSIEENEMSMVFTAVSVTKKKIADDEFVIPEGYNKMSMSEFENMFGGQ
jgi:hypothetical protein